MEFLLIPLVLIIAGIVLFMNYKKVKKQFDNIRSVEKTTVAAIHENHDHFLIEFGTGTYQHYVELYGTVKCDAPLLSAITARPCVFSEHKVQRTYEVMVQEKDAQGNMVTRMRQQTETLSSNRQSVSFRIAEDDSYVDIMPDGADIFPIQSHASQTGSLDPAIAGKLGISLGYRIGNTRGYSITEKIIPLEQNLYVLGEANDRAGKLTISKPREKDKSFILSTTQEDVLLEKLALKIKWFRLGFWAAIIGGILSLVFLAYSYLETGIKF
ncbi:MAG TPA: GIDE domain-containing protein [Cyclobacteriaceae bacterium]|nr:GIDE domain-containing protein [Cyclobacteriaceae bacterium]